MTDYKIRVDSSTKPSQLSRYGKSTAAWTTEVNNSIVRSGLIYCCNNGPNKILYEGILAALSTLDPEHFYEAGTDSVTVFVDSQIILNQLNKKAEAIKMSKHYDLVQEFCKKHPNVAFEFLYQGEDERAYKKVDTLSKIGRSWIQKML